MNIGTNHFKVVLNALAPYRSLKIKRATNQPPQDTELLTSYEINGIISAAHEKVSRNDELPSEFLNATIALFSATKGQQRNDKFVADGKEIKFVEEFLYLGEKVDADGGAAINIHCCSRPAPMSVTALLLLTKVMLGAKSSV